MSCICQKIYEIFSYFSKLINLQFPSFRPMGNPTGLCRCSVCSTLWLVTLTRVETRFALFWRQLNNFKLLAAKILAPGGICHILGAMARRHHGVFGLAPEHRLGRGSGQRPVLCALDPGPVHATRPRRRRLVADVSERVPGA